MMGVMVMTMMIMTSVMVLIMRIMVIVGGGKIMMVSVIGNIEEEQYSTVQYSTVGNHEGR